MQSLLFCALITLGVQFAPEVPNPIKEEMGLEIKGVVNRLARRRAASLARRR